MAIEIEERLEVEAPMDVVWRFLVDPHKVVTCMPGASLDEVVDERTFVGSVKVKLGAITTGYKGRVEFVEVDEQAHTLRIAAEGREKGGGTARGTVCCRLELLPNGATELVTEAKVDLTGRVMQMGRGMIKGVAHQLFQEFASRTRDRLLSEQAEAGAAAANAEPSQAAGASQAPAGELAPAGEGAAISVVSLLAKTLWSAIAGFFRRLFGGSAS
jgi:carbon monoxide dehydrogenase subunit G